MTQVPAAARSAEAEPTDHLHQFLRESDAVAIVMVTPDGRVVGWNPGAQLLLGYSPEQIVGRHLCVLEPAGEPGVEAVDGWLAGVAATGWGERQASMRTSDGTVRWVRVLTIALRDEAGQLRRFAAIAHAADNEQVAELALARTAGELERRATTDPLTGLKNRGEFDRMLRTLTRERFSALAIDVDNLKQVNDRSGHEAGDVLLRSVATTLSLLVRGWDVIARVGGDEFAVLLPGAGPEEAAGVAERMRVAVSSLITPSARISVGWASGEPGTDPRVVWRMADEGLMRAKRAGRDQIVGVELPPASAPEGPAPGRVLTDLLSGGPLAAVFQPIVALADRHVIGYEALARPAHYAPDDSVEPLFYGAEQAGRLADLDWICRRVAVAGASGLPADAALFLNISTAALLDPQHAVDQLLLLLRWARWPAGRTVLMLSGHERVANRARLPEVLAEYRGEGFRFALSHVGTGHWPDTSLADAGPEFLTIDPILWMNPSFGVSSRAINGALALARSLGAVIIAQGVESQAAVHQVEALGIRFGQGYALGRPAPSGAKTPSVSSRPSG